MTGASYNGVNFEAFLYNGVTMLDLGTLPGFAGSEGLGINDRGQVVGVALGGAGGTLEGFLYDNGKMFALNSLILPTDPLYGAVSFNNAARGINDDGQIVAYGCYTSGPLNGQCRAFRLDPVPAFAGTPGYSNCHGKSVSALAQQYGGLDAAAAALGYSSVQVLQNDITAYCAG